jgi:hypothetical protein
LGVLNEKRCKRQKQRRSTKKRKNTKKQVKIGGTGVMLNANDKTAYDTFINNSNFRLLGSGSNGVSIIAELLVY